MEEHKITSTDTNDASAKEQPSPRPWVKPAFEQMSLKKAMAGGTFPSATDGPGTYS